MATEFDPTTSGGTAPEPATAFTGASFGADGLAAPAADASLLLGGDPVVRIIRPPIGIDPDPIPPPPLPLVPVINSVQPGQVPAGFTSSVTASGFALPVNAARYTVINAQGFPAGVQVLGATGSSFSVTLTLSVPAATPAGQYRLRVESNGFASEGLLQIVAAVGPRLDSVQPTTIPAAATSSVLAFGQNLPGSAAAYGVVGTNGVPVAQVTGAFGGGTQVSLQITVPASTPAGQYLLRVSVSGAASQVPLQISGTSFGPVISSVQPSQLQTGASNTLTVTGTNLPANAGNYRVITNAGANAPGFFVTGAFGGGMQVTLQVFVDALTPQGTYRLRVENAGFASEALLTVGQGAVTISSVQPSTFQAGAQTQVNVTGTNLPAVAAGYSIPSVPGAVFEVLFFSSSLTSVALRITIPAGTPAGAYQLRAQSGGSVAQFPIQIAGMGGGTLQITSVAPSELSQGLVNTVTVTGTALPGTRASYVVINRFGQVAAGVGVITAFGGGSQVTLQISVGLNTLPGSYRLRVTSQGQASEFPISIGGVIFFGAGEQTAQ